MCDFSFNVHIRSVMCDFSLNIRSVMCEFSLNVHSFILQSRPELSLLGMRSDVMDSNQSFCISIFPSL